MTLEERLRAALADSPVDGIATQAHIDAMVDHLMPVLEPLVRAGVPREEFALLRGNAVVVGPQSHDQWNEGTTLEEARRIWYPDTKLMRRTTIVVSEVGPWTPVEGRRDAES